MGHDSELSVAENGTVLGSLQPVSLQERIG